LDIPTWHHETPCSVDDDVIACDVRVGLFEESGNVGARNFDVKKLVDASARIDDTSAKN
jgi:hypothetical protein